MLFHHGESGAAIIDYGGDGIGDALVLLATRAAMKTPIPGAFAAELVDTAPSVDQLGAFSNMLRERLKIIC